MKGINLILAGALMVFTGTASAQKFKDKVKNKANALSQKATQGSYKKYDFTDDSGISGTYFTNDQIIDRQNTVGFRYTKEKDGEIINELYVELGGRGYGDRPNSVTFTLKEKYKTKYNFNYFYITDKDCPNLANNHDNFVFMEISENVYAFAQENKVLCVAAKDSAKFADYDTETAQVLYDQNMAKANKEAMDKETEIWKKNAVYAKNIGKIVFATEDYHLMKRGYGNKPPMVNGKDFKTVLDMAGNMQYMAFFEYPPSVAYPGMELNIEYELGGQKTSRTELKAKSAAWSKMVKRLEANDFQYRHHSPRALRTYNQYHSQYVQDYAFMHVLYLNKDKFMIGQKYDLTVKMYTSRDGENGELIAEGVVQLLYSSEAHLAFNGDPDKPEKKAIWTQYEEFLDE
ncbi:MAG: hypothetical protein ACWA41_08680 [Putridiphycobacter sp.]